MAPRLERRAVPQGGGGEGGVRGGGGRKKRKKSGRNQEEKGREGRQMEEGAEGEVSRRGNDSKVEGLLMSYISLWQHLYRLGGHGARARSLLLESPAGIPWEQEALVIVGGEQDREREREGGRRGQREDGGNMDRATWWALARAGRRACGSFDPAGTWHTQHRVGRMEEDRGFLGKGVSATV